MKQTISQGGFPVVNMSDDAKIADMGSHGGESIPDFPTGNKTALIWIENSPSLSIQE
jgi:hypothetical protein